MQHSLITTFLLALIPAAAIAQKAETLLSRPLNGEPGLPRFAVTGASVYATFAIQVSPGSLSLRSEDDGSTWLSAGNPTSSAAVPWTAPQFITSGSSFFSLWNDKRNGRIDTYLNFSKDEGATWAASDVRVNADPSGVTRLVEGGAAVRGSSVYVAWQDERGGDPRVYFNRSTNAGQSWLSSDIRLSSSAPGTRFSKNPQVAVSSASVLVAWEGAPLARRSPGPPDLYINYSKDGGQTWLNTEIQVNDIRVARSFQIATSGARTYLVWLGGGGVSFDSSSDGGSTWKTSDVRLDSGTSVPEGVQIAVKGSSVFVTWESAGDMYFNHSNDWGATWQAAALKLNGSASTKNQNSQLLVRGSLVAVAWDGLPVSAPNTGTGIYCNYSLDGGATWLSSESRVDTDHTGSAIAPPGVQWPQIAATDSSLLVTWHRTIILSPPSTIRFNIPFGVQPYGSGTAGTANLVPTLTTTGYPITGQSMNLNLSNGLGSAPAVLAVGFLQASQVATPIIGGTLLVSPTFTVPVSLNGSGAAPLSIPVPNDPNLRGLNVNFQGLIFDQGAPVGVSMSNAIQVWIG